MAALLRKGESMKYQEKVDLVRNNIISNAQTYKNNLAGKYYLYIFENRCFEMYFGTDNYMHLTGVGSKVSPKQFYQLAKDKKLQDNQIFFSPRYPLKTALYKTANLINLPDFTREGYFVIKDLETDTAKYPYAITNIDQSVLIGLKEEEDTDIYIPKSFRVKGKIFDKADDDKLFEINCIMSKTDKSALYNNILYCENIDFDSMKPEIIAKIDSNAIDVDNN